ncbi:hypothetical protein M433DRAFT_150862 [Acidomyces richmondensis BFW]|nr:MAG: hypothetical protein FE78DRAFT_86897 [Acidomyces sp. 'richmondensis']KYG48681.1 hypothetical protein M433DRAFT_150862 [Acidomyces richmondensis BFW]
MSNPITVRNLTAQPLTVKLIELYETPNQKDFTPNVGFSVSNLASNFNTLLNNSKGSGSRSSNVQLSDSTQSFIKQDIDLRMEPFSTHNTNIMRTPRSQREILRFTFQGDGGGRWRIDFPTPPPTSQRLTSLSPDPKHDYTALYFRSSSSLVLFENTNLQCWMKEFKNETPLSALSIPGTHNSPTCHKALPSVRCQAVSPREQLENGVRFFDIRVQPSNPQDPKDDGLNLVHGAFPISLTGPKKFRDLLNEVKDFLKANPSETLIMSLKREGTGNATDQQLSIILKDHYTNPQEWWTQPHIPTLGEARGRIVLMRRFTLADRLKHEWSGKGWCLNAENWAYNTPNCQYGDVCVQDFCEVLETENIDKKIKLCCDHFERAGAVVASIPGMAGHSTHPVHPGPLYLNFLSASNFWKMGCWPDKIAAKINPAITAFLCEKHNLGETGLDGPGKKFNGVGGVGIVVTDWVGKDGDWDLIKCIVGMNSRLLHRQNGRGWR